MPSHNRRDTSNYFHRLKLTYSLHQSLSIAYFYALLTILYYYFSTSKQFKTYFYKDGVKMKQKMNSITSQLFLFFNITLLFTFPLTQQSPLIVRLFSGHTLLLTQLIPAFSYLLILGVSFGVEKTGYLNVIRMLCTLFCIYHLVQLFC